MKPLMMNVITENQRAFVSGRLIQDNIVVAQEAFHYLKRKKKGRKVEMAVKVDMNKAYDRLEWDFVEETMRRMGFGERWIGWVMECIKSVRLNLMVGGRKIADLDMERGIRQGDPLSPYLFILATDVLSRMVRWHADNRKLKGIKMASKCPVLTHCFFADDAIFFINGKRQNCEILKAVLECYCSASGQAINLEKSNIFFSKNANERDKREAFKVLGIKGSEEPGRYLGMPLIWGKSKSEALGFVKNKVRGKLQGWKQKVLTFAGREVLIKAVANAIPIYSMSCFKFPKKVCVELDGMIANFWWGQTNQEGKIHWKAWKGLSRPKEEGGMGFRELEKFNKALLAKTAWRILKNPDDMWSRILKGIYFPKTDFMSAKKGGHASWGWSSILEGRELIREGLCWRIGDGKMAKVFTDNWIPTIKGYRLREKELTEVMKEVESLIRGGKWDLGELEGIIEEDEMDAIKCIKIPSVRSPDELMWLDSKDGIYSVKRGYVQEKNRGSKEGGKDPGSSHRPAKQLWKAIWKIKMPPKICHFMWRMVNDALATKENLFRRKCGNSPVCLLCNEQVETTEHLIFLCPWAKQCWFGSPLTLRVDEWNIQRVDRWLEEWVGREGGPDEGELALLAGICWEIWKGRCRYIFEGIEVDAWGCIANAMRMVRDYRNAEMKEKKSCGSEERRSKWQKPELGAVKINVDASFCQKSKDAAIGIVGRDWNGKFIGGIGKQIKADSAFMAEVLSVLEALECGEIWWGGRITIETDCQSLYRMLEDREIKGCEWQSVDIIKQCMVKLDSDICKNWELVNVARSGNRAADHLATLVMRGLVPQGWLCKPPTSLMRVMMEDLEDGHKGRTGVG